MQSACIRDTIRASGKIYDQNALPSWWEKGCGLWLALANRRTNRKKNTSHTVSTVQQLPTDYWNATELEAWRREEVAEKWGEENQPPTSCVARFASEAKAKCRSNNCNNCNDCNLKQQHKKNRVIFKPRTQSHHQLPVVGCWICIRIGIGPTTHGLKRCVRVCVYVCMAAAWDRPNGPYVCLLCFCCCSGFATVLVFFFSFVLLAECISPVQHHYAGASRCNARHMQIGPRFGLKYLGQLFADHFFFCVWISLFRSLFWIRVIAYGTNRTWLEPGVSHDSFWDLVGNA